MFTLVQFQKWVQSVARCIDAVLARYTHKRFGPFSIIFSCIYCTKYFQQFCFALLGNYGHRKRWKHVRTCVYVGGLLQWSCAVLFFWWWCVICWDWCLARQDWCLKTIQLIALAWLIVVDCSSWCMYNLLNSANSAFIILHWPECWTTHSV